MNFIFKIIEWMDYILVPFHMQNERLFILRSAKKIFKELGLKPIPILYDDDKYCYYNPNEIFIGIGVGFFNKNWNRIFDYVNGDFNNNRKNKLFFVIAHEIAHYFQDSKYPKWHYHFLEKCDYIYWKSNATPKQYRELKTEANADRIALILSKKFGYALDK